MENIESIKNIDFPSYTKIKETQEPLHDMTTEHNRIFRTEAASISLIRFSPVQLINKMMKKFKHRKESEKR